MSFHHGSRSPTDSTIPVTPPDKARRLGQILSDAVQKNKRVKTSHVVPANPRLEACIAHVWKVLNFHAESATGMPLVIDWNPGNWEFLMKDEIKQYLEKGVPMNFPRSPPEDANLLLLAIADHFNTKTDYRNRGRVEQGVGPIHVTKDDENGLHIILY